MSVVEESTKNSKYVCAAMGELVMHCCQNKLFLCVAEPRPIRKI